MKGEATHRLGTEAETYLQPRTHEHNVLHAIWI